MLHLHFEILGCWVRDRPAAIPFCPSESLDLPLDVIRNQIGTEFRHGGMPQLCDQQDRCYAQLYANYRSEWQAFAQKTRVSRLLEDEGQSKPGNVREAKALAESAEHRYR